MKNLNRLLKSKLKILKHKMLLKRLRKKRKLVKLAMLLKGHKELY